MNIREAKQQIKNAMIAYFTKDEFGNYLLPPERQRPVFLLGAPGIGKTAIMEQIAQELEVGFVSYSMTHHTRQSALGLPFIATKTYDGVEYQVSEYTMSEIIASVYEAMEATGRREGILFLDEINCVSETLTPAMLQFLQYKIFGRHAVPDGWIVVTAGNPPEYNRTAHDFDIATWDRLKRIEVEPDYDVWREFAVSAEVHPAVITYLDIERSHFYAVEATPDGASFVTARGWDDLSAMIKLYEAQGLTVDELLVEQYVQNGEIAKRFAMYYDLFTKYRSDYQIDRILDGSADAGLAERAAAAPFDERVAVMGLIVDATVSCLREAVMEEKAAAFGHSVLADLKERLAAEGVAEDADASALIRATTTELARTRDTERAASLLSDERYRSFERITRGRHVQPAARALQRATRRAGCGHRYGGRRLGQRVQVRGRGLRRGPGDAHAGDRLVREPRRHGLHQRPRLRPLLRPQPEPPVLRAWPRPGRPHRPHHTGRGVELPIIRRDYSRWCICVGRS